MFVIVHKISSKMSLLIKLPKSSNRQGDGHVIGIYEVVDCAL